MGEEPHSRLPRSGKRCAAIVIPLFESRIVALLFPHSLKLHDRRRKYHAVGSWLTPGQHDGAKLGHPGRRIKDGGRPADSRRAGKNERNPSPRVLQKNLQIDVG
jgi:hypothetical protein